MILTCYKTSQRSVGFVTIQNVERSAMQQTTVLELGKLLRAGQTVHLIDVRTEKEFQEVHAETARNIPLNQLAPDSLPSLPDQEDPLFVICKSGGRSRQACQLLAAAGFTTINVEGGTDEWVRQGLPIIRGQQTMSLERQVRIAAGSLVLLGVVLGLSVHPYCVGLSAFVGAGLVFAGITDTCGMALLLARMPWNHVNSGNSQTGTAAGISAGRNDRTTANPESSKWALNREQPQARPGGT